jgi:hypothetical protein
LVRAGGRVADESMAISNAVTESPDTYHYAAEVVPIRQTEDGPLDPVNTPVMVPARVVPRRRTVLRLPEHPTGDLVCPFHVA